MRINEVKKKIEQIKIKKTNKQKTKNQKKPGSNINYSR